MKRDNIKIIINTIIIILSGFVLFGLGAYKGLKECECNDVAVKNEIKNQEVQEFSYWASVDTLYKDSIILYKYKNNCPYPYVYLKVDIKQKAEFVSLDGVTFMCK